MILRHLSHLQDGLPALRASGRVKLVERLNQLDHLRTADERHVEGGSHCLEGDVVVSGSDAAASHHEGELGAQGSHFGGDLLLVVADHQDAGQLDAQSV